MSDELNKVECCFIVDVIVVCIEVVEISIGKNQVCGYYHITLFQAYVAKELIEIYDKRVIELNFLSTV